MLVATGPGVRVGHGVRVGQMRVGVRVGQTRVGVGVQVGTGVSVGNGVSVGVGVAVGGMGVGVGVAVYHGPTGNGVEVGQTRVAVGQMRGVAVATGAEVAAGTAAITSDARNESPTSGKLK